MIERLAIKNFQKHRKRIVKFAKVTTFIGPSDAGKSSVLRVLRFVCLNKPNGDSFISHGEKSCKLKLVVDGRTIIRKKGVVNEYSLDNKKFSAFRNEVPPEIATLLGVSDLNFQKQLDLPYWFAETAGKVSRELNSIVDLSLIDDVSTKVANEVRSARSEVEVSESRLEIAKQQVKEFDRAKLVDARLVEVEELQVRFDASSSKKASIKGVADEITSLSIKAARAASFVSACEDAIQLGSRLKVVSSKKFALKELADRLANTDLKSIPLLPDFSEIERLLLTLDKLRSRRGLLRNLVVELRDTEAEACRVNEEAERIGKDLSRETRCPLCQKPMK